MARTNYSKTFGKAMRAKGVRSRDEYLMDVYAEKKRGEDLPWSKLTEEDVRMIREAKEKREDLREHIKLSLSNEALAKQLGVHVRTIEKVLSFETWSHTR